MSLEVVAGLLGSQLVRAVASDMATTLLCQALQYVVASMAPSQMDTGTGQAAVPAGTVASRTTAPELRALPTIEIVSAVAGRVRLRVHGVRDNAGRAAEVASTVRELNGVTSADTNPRTGTLLVHFNPRQTGVSAIVAALEPARPARRPRPAERTSHLRLVVG